MAEEIVMTSGPFRRLHHVLVVVHDIDEAVRYYESVGIGPWSDLPPLSGFTELSVPNREAFLAIRFKFANVDNAQIQLCEPPQQDCPQRRFLDTHGEGVFQLGFEVDDADSAETSAQGWGLDMLMRGRRPDSSGFTYFDTLDRAGVVLMVRQTPAPS
jgi:methylmalonyl-CoA/ethylmalonyl-CoA epimerase